MVDVDTLGEVRKANTLEGHIIALCVCTFRRIHHCMETRVRALFVVRFH